MENTLLRGGSTSTRHFLSLACLAEEYRVILHRWRLTKLCIDVYAQCTHLHRTCAGVRDLFSSRESFNFVEKLRF